MKFHRVCVWGGGGGGGGGRGWRGVEGGESEFTTSSTLMLFTKWCAKESQMFKYNWI